MKNKFLVSIALVVFSFFSCTKEAPKATDETVKGHENPQKIVIRFTEGKEIKDGSNTYFSSVKVRLEENEKLKIPIVQERIFTDTRDQGVIVNETSPVLLVEGKSYGLEVFYYNRKGVLMNHEFLTPQMSPIHQHFFIPRQIKSIKSGVEVGKKENVISYHYRDTKPYNQMLGEEEVTLRGENDPVGLKGYFSVDKAYQEFSLQTILVHVIGGTKLDKSGKAYPFHSPSARVIGTTDFKQPISVKVFTSEESPDYKQELSKEYGIPLDEVEKELSKREEIFKNSPKIKI